MSIDFASILDSAQSCSYKDFWAIKRRLHKIKNIKDSQEREGALNSLRESINQNIGKLDRKAARKLALSYPKQLPVSQQIEKIVAEIKENQVVIVAGETGSGKTTQLPKACIEAGLGVKGLIGHTQPRRLAARTVSKRIAEELNSEVGDIVGYQVRFTDQVSDESFIKVMTDGILLNEIKFDRYLNKYEALIIDEAHERSLNIDFLLGYLKNILQKRPELKLIITSATIDVERFSKFFSNAPVFSVSGRSYPVDIHYRPAISDSEYDLSLSEQIASIVDEIVQEEKSRSWPIGDVLVFLPGEREIREIAKALKDFEWRDTEILPLYARLGEKDQNRIFQSHRGRRIVLSTNVAETSITVPGIRYVIDPGTVRISRYSYRSKLQRLPIEPVSQASANQRAGRCGRIAEGICYRLYSENDFLSRPEFTDPEILRTNLAAVILKMLDSGIGDVYEFKFIDSPDNKVWNDGFKLLFELGAVGQNKKLTKLGKKLAAIPSDPRLGKMLLSAAEKNCLKEVLLIVSGLSIQDPRERPADKKQAADQCHALYKDPDSDFVALLNLWHSYEEHRQQQSNNQIKKHCQKNFLSFMRMREWREVHRQLHLVLKDMGFAENNESASYENIHKALLSGMLGNIGRHDEKREYIGCRNRRFLLAPGTGLQKKRPKWIFSAEIVETQQVYARSNARIEPEWIEELSAHLIKKSWSEPHWQAKNAQVIAKEKVTLYGLELVRNRNVNFSFIDPKASREIFIRSGLVEGQYKTRDKAIVANRKLISEIEAIEDRTRKRDVLVDDDVVFELYDKSIPEYVVSGASFEKWRKKLSSAEGKELFFTETSLKRSDAEGFDSELFPDYLENNGIKFPLNYHFNPGSKNDGINVSVPVTAITQITVEALERGVPGLLREKCIQLIKNLPRTIRKNFVPVPDVVDQILPKIESSEESLLEALSKQLKFLKGQEVPIEAWKVELLDDHLRLNIQVLDDRGKLLEQGRDLVAVAKKVKSKVQTTSAVLNADSEQKTLSGKEWVFGDISVKQEVKKAGVIISQFPALQDQVNLVQLVFCMDKNQANTLTKVAVARLLSFRLTSQIEMFEKDFANYKKMGLLYAPVGQAKGFYGDFVLASIKNYFLADELPTNKTGFEALYSEKKSGYFDFARQFSDLVYEVLLRFHNIKKSLKGKVNLSMALPLGDLQAQLSNLVFDKFLTVTPYERIQEYPRYLEACLIRFEKMSREMGNERRYVPILKSWEQQYQDRKKQHDIQGIYDPNLEHFRWMIEEMRVSWYAQRLGTSETVSEKRLNKIWESVKR